MVYHAQGTLGDVWGDLVGPPNTFVMLHGEPESMFTRLTFDIFTSRCCQAHQHEALAERSSNLPLNLNLHYGKVKNLSSKIEPAFAVST